VKIAGRWRSSTRPWTTARASVLRLYRDCTALQLAFLAELQRALPFRIASCSATTAESSPRLCARSPGGWYPASLIPATAAQQNGKVERSYRIDQERFWTPSVTDFDEAPRPSGMGENYNYERFSWRCRGGRQPKSLLVSPGFRRVIATSATAR